MSRVKLINENSAVKTMFGLGKRKAQNTEEIEEELVIDSEGVDEFGLGTTQQAPANPPATMTAQQSVVDLRNYIDEVSRRIEEITSIKGEIDRIVQMKPVIENYVNTLNEVLKILNEINNLLNRLEELRRRL